MASESRRKAELLREGTIKRGLGFGDKKVVEVEALAKMADFYDELAAAIEDLHRQIARKDAAVRAARAGLKAREAQTTASRRWLANKRKGMHVPDSSAQEAMYAARDEHSAALDAFARLDETERRREATREAGDG